jgi:hypothetical protein
MIGQSPSRFHFLVAAPVAPPQAQRNGRKSIRKAKVTAAAGGRFSLDVGLLCADQNQS